MREPVFNAAGLFDENYLYFASESIGAGRSEHDVELIWRLLALEPGMEILDLACGHGRIANRLAARGCRVTGLDAARLYLDLADRDAAARGVHVDYVHGDMRALPWRDRFDRVVNWDTAFGFFDDAGNRTVLAEVRRALKPGGRFLLELPNRDWLAREFQPALVLERDGNLQIDHRRLDPFMGGIVAERIVVRSGQVSRTPYFLRLFTFTELRDWLLAAGFKAVAGYGEEGSPLSPFDRRLLMVASR